MEMDTEELKGPEDEVMITDDGVLFQNIEK